MAKRIPDSPLIIVVCGVVLLVFAAISASGLLEGAYAVVAGVLSAAATGMFSYGLRKRLGKSGLSLPLSSAALKSKTDVMQRAGDLASETLTPARKREIVQQGIHAYRHVVANRQQYMVRLRKQEARAIAASRPSLVNKAAWSSISATRSDRGYRFVMGFRNRGCAYWRENPFQLGCYCCGYCSGTAPDVEPTELELEHQFNDALEQALKEGPAFDVVEFLNDGSFFNDGELPPAFRHRLFQELNGRPYITRVLVETRPGYVDREKVSSLLRELTRNQRLEVGIGLETADDFIREACIGKGFPRADFEKAVDCLSFDRRIGIVAYSLVKPPFLSESESIEDEISTARYLSRLAAEKRCDITLKLEPAVVAKGTMLDFLYFDGEKITGQGYKVLSYWTVVEILCRLDREGIALPVRVGAREDMDVIEKLSAVYNRSGRYSKCDFILYEGVQHYNAHGSVARLLVEIDKAFHDPDGTFQDWKFSLGLQNTKTAIEDCLEAFSGEIRQFKDEPAEASRREFLHWIYEGLERIEYGHDEARFARRLYGKWRLTPERAREDVEQLVRRVFAEVAKGVWVEILELYFERDRPGLLRIRLRIRDAKTMDTLYNVWAGIPTMPADSAPASTPVRAG